MNGLPAVLAQRVDGTNAEFDLHIAADCRWFDGHFPGWPILPGVVHIGWAVHFATLAFALTTPAQSLRRIKFKRPILPEARLTLRLRRHADQVTYDYLAGGASVSSGVLHFGC